MCSQKAKMAIFVVFEIFGVKIKKNNEEAENCMEYVEIYVWALDDAF